MPCIVFVKKPNGGEEDKLLVNCVDFIDGLYRILILKNFGYTPLSLNCPGIEIGFNPKNDNSFFLTLLDNSAIDYKRDPLKTVIQNFCDYAKMLTRPDINKVTLGYFKLNTDEASLEETLRRVEKMYDPIEPKNICV